MKIFFVDESNITKEDRLGFFLCGGLIFKDEEAGALSRELLRLKEIKWKIPAERPIKWGNPRWGKQLPLDKTLHAKIKAHVLKLIGQSGVTIIICLSPQDFYHVPSKRSRPVGKLIIDPVKYGRSVLFGLNVVLQRFDGFLGEVDDFGFVLLDRPAHNQEQLVRDHCFQAFHRGTSKSNLAHIVYPALQVAVDYSQCHQITDIAIGAIQHSLRELSYNFLPQFKGKFWGKPTLGTNRRRVTGYGFNVYPIQAKSAYVQNQLDRTHEKFRRLINKPAI